VVRPDARRHPRPLKQSYSWGMTIGIGVLATGDRFKPDTVILVADTLGSYGDMYSTPGLRKMFVEADDNFFAVAADQIERASELVPMIRARLRELPRRDHGPIYDSLHHAVRDYYNQRATYEVLPKFMLTLEDWKSKKLDPDLRNTITREWHSFYFGSQLIIGTFADSGQALLYLVKGSSLKEHESGPPTVEFVTSSTLPGFTAIGSGAINAEFWLGYRNHTLSCSPKRAAYHAYEAKLMAESSAYVNDVTDMLVATRGGHVHLTKQKPESGDWSMSEFADLYKTYGPQSTEPLGIAPGSSDERDKLFQ
jgi:hypothetical protein